MSYLKTVGIEVTIANGESLSDSADLKGGCIVGINMPAVWTAAGLSFQGSEDDTTFVDIYNNGGEITLLSAVVGTDRRILVSPVDFVGAGRFVKVRSGTTGSAQAQGAARIITLLVRPV